MQTIVKSNKQANKEAAPKGYATAVKVWLVAGLFMIFVQVVVGGITRLTGSGLSITRWEIVTGMLPPLSGEAWDKEFDLYKATPQYQKINEGMSLADFKFIYFWEYFHRLWARLMGLVFLIPFAIFYFRGQFDKPLLRKLGVVFLLAAIVASFGWIMVASGLIDRPWVNAYKLTMHLSLALILFSYLLWTTFQVLQPRPKVIHNKMLKKGAIALIIVTAVQIVLGGVMSGMKAGLYYPSWPDMNGELVPAILLQASEWNVENLINYDRSLFMPALIQILHRVTAYVLTIIVLWFTYQGFKQVNRPAYRAALLLLVTMLIMQVTLGILTLVNSIGIIPVGLGVLHQAGALLLLTAVLLINYLTRRQEDINDVENHVENI